MAEIASKILIEACVDSVGSALALVPIASPIRARVLPNHEALFAEVQIGLSFVETWGLEVDQRLAPFSAGLRKELFAGGSTPSIGLLKAVQRAVPNTPIMV
jgi:hypothetical protein